MGMTIPQIVDRLPEHRSRILKARFRDQTVNDLCRDYDLLLKSLTNHQGSDEAIELELRRLAQALEREMLIWLERHADDPT